VRDLAADDWQDRLGRHYDLYAAFVSGLGGDLAGQPVVRLDGGPISVGSKTEFLFRLGEQRAALHPFIHNVYGLIRDLWADPAVPFIFEGAQAVGLDPRFGVYPDVTSSDPTFHGIVASTEGLIQTGAIAVRMATIKATYTSSVGTRRLPTMMPPDLAHRIREDAHEYGATTKRPRDIAYIDLPCLRFFAQVSGATHLVLTHLDIAYRTCRCGSAPTTWMPRASRRLPARPGHPGQRSGPVPRSALVGRGGGAQRLPAGRLPDAALQYIAFLAGALGVTPLFGTTGPAREALIAWLPG
jgi:adenylosuccinate synthase